MSYQLNLTSWKKDREALSAVRRAVFIEEQHVPENMEWDEFDEESLHILVTNENKKPVATARMKADGHIGRMAVLADYRNKGIGSAILRQLLKSAAQQNFPKVYLHAQTSAIAFYEKLGFVTCSDEFMDAGIPHKSMQLSL